jgi:RND family efflux transporter MFP subunit
MTVHASFPRCCHLLLAGLLFTGAVVGCHGDAPPSPEPVPRAPVQAQAAKPILMGEWTELLGTTQPLPNRSARISATMEGHVLSVLGDGKGAVVAEGQQVKAGQVIVRLDDSVLRANSEKLQAALSDVNELQKQAGFALELANLDVNRLKELRQGSSTGSSQPLVSRVELEKAIVLQKDAQSKLKAAAAKQAAAQADLKALDKQMEFFTLRAPIAGRLSIVQAVPGQTLSPGTVVADVVDLDQIDVLCFAPPDAASRLVLDQPAKLLIEEPGTREAKEPLTGKVAFVGVQAQPETGNVPVKVRFPNPELRLRAHAIVRVHVLTQPEQERLTIPETAVMEDRDVPAVLVVQDVKTENTAGGEEKSGKALKLQAVLGIRDRDRGIIEILSLEDPATKEKVAPSSVLFVTAGGNGLLNDDIVLLQHEEPKEKK